MHAAKILRKHRKIGKQEKITSLPPLMTVRNAEKHASLKLSADGLQGSNVIRTNTYYETVSKV